MVDGVEGAEYEMIGTGTLIFSPDSKHLAYAAQRDGKWRVVVDDVEGELYEPIFWLVRPFSARTASAWLMWHSVLTSGWW